MVGWFGLVWSIGVVPKKNPEAPPLGVIPKPPIRISILKGKQD